MLNGLFACETKNPHRGYGRPKTDDSVMILPVHLLCLWELTQVHSIDSNVCIGCETTAGDLYRQISHSVSTDSAKLSVDGCICCFVFLTLQTY